MFQISNPRCHSAKLGSGTQILSNDHIDLKALFKASRNNNFDELQDFKHCMTGLL